MEGQSSLTQFYDTLKAQLSEPEDRASTTIDVRRSPAGLDRSPGEMMYRNKAIVNADHLKDKCRKHILVDMYCKIIPLDDDYVCGNQGQMCQDVDNMLDKKGLSASQYLKSCFESTDAPLLEFIIRSTENIAKSYLEETQKELKDAQDNDVKIDEPKEPTLDDEAINDQLIDIKQDPEYNSFIDKLKEKTINKIVNDVSKIIADKKEEKKMTFDTTPIENTNESVISVGMEYLQKNVWNESTQLSADIQEEMIGMAIREATLNQFDVVFNQPGKEFREYASRIRYGKGAVINESAVTYIKEKVE